MLKSYLAVMFGGALGSGLRLWVSNWCATHFGQTFPWGTMVANVAGCFLIGIFAGLTGTEGVFTTTPLVRQLVMVGIFGGFTTYSSFSLQTIELFANGQILHGVANILATLALCLLGSWLGLAAAGLLHPR